MDVTPSNHKTNLKNEDLVLIYCRVYCLLEMGNTNAKGAEDKLQQVHQPPPQHDICEACEEGNLVLVERYVKAGEDVNQTVDGEQCTPLMIASFDGNYKFVDFLLKNNANVNVCDDNGWTSLMCASLNGHSEVVKLLHEYGAQVDLQNNNGWTALMVASQNGHSEVVKLLHEYGAQVDLQDNNGFTALMKASRNGHSEIVKLLHEYGAMAVSCPNMAEHRALQKCADTLTSLLQHQVVTISTSLLAKGLSTDDLHGWVLTANGVSNKEKATRILACVMDQVKARTQSFKLFVEVLEENSRNDAVEVILEYLGMHQTDRWAWGGHSLSATPSQQGLVISPVYT